MRTDIIKESEWTAYLEDLLATDEQADFGEQINRWHTFLEQEVLGAFESQRSPEGMPWEEWHWRRLKYHGEQKALLNTGRLRNSFIRGDGENIDIVDAKHGEYGSDVPYAGVHQYGGSVTPYATLYQRHTYKQLKSATIEVDPRPMLGVRDDMADVFADSIADSLVEQMKG